MKDFLLKDNYTNFEIKNYDFKTTNYIDYVLQKIWLHLKFIKGEYFLDVTKGIDYFDFVFEKQNSIFSILDYLKSKIKELDFIDKIELFEITDFDNKTRKLKINMKLKIKNINNSLELQMEV